MLIPLGILAASGAGVAGSYDWLETITVGSGGSTSVTFSNLNTYSSTYQHLQIRAVARTSGWSGFAINSMFSRLNGDSGNNYALHQLLGSGSSVSSFAATSQNRALTGMTATQDATSSAFAASVIDLLDPFEAKNKTFRSLDGFATTRISLDSGLWMNTASVTSWTILPENGSFVQGSRFSLYGLKAS